MSLWSWDENYLKKGHIKSTEDNTNNTIQFYVWVAVKLSISKDIYPVNKRCPRPCTSGWESCTLQYKVNSQKVILLFLTLVKYGGFYSLQMAKLPKGQTVFDMSFRVWVCRYTHSYQGPITKEDNRSIR